jgi:hypothetical protein
MAQTPDEREDELMRMVFSKNRNGFLGTVKLDTDYSYMTFYREQKEIDDNGGLLEEETETGGEGGDTPSTPEERDLQLLLQQRSEGDPSDQKRSDE